MITAGRKDNPTIKTLLSPKELALAIGVSESTLKRWADEGLVQVSRTAGGHRRIPLPEALRFVRESRATIVRPDLLQLPELENVQDEITSGRATDESLFQALKEGDTQRVRGLVLGAYVSGRSTAAIFDGPLATAMHRLGDLWKHDELGILIEHRATDICLQAINQLRSLLPAPTPQAPLALGGCAEQDPYILPSLMAATTLADIGWREINFGPHTPIDVLLRAAQRYTPKLVWYSSSVRVDTAQMSADITRLAGELQATRTHLLVGGRGLDDLSLPSLPNLRRGRDMAELVAAAQTLTR